MPASDELVRWEAVYYGPTPEPSREYSHAWGVRPVGTREIQGLGFTERDARATVDDWNRHVGLKAENERLTALLAERDAEVARLAAAGDALAEAARICDGVMMAAFVPSPEFDDMEPSEGWRMLRSALDDWRAALAARGGEVRG